MATGILTPGQGPPFVLPYGWNGTDFYGLRVDTTGLTVPSLRTSLMQDRNSLVVDLQWGALVGNHGVTTRATYTVPAARFAVINATYLAILTIPAAASGSVWVTARTRVLSLCSVYPTSNLDFQPKGNTPNLLLLPGDVVSIKSINPSATNLDMYGVAFMLEFAM